jgi:CHAD domain-containing protein
MKKIWKRKHSLAENVRLHLPEASTKYFLAGRAAMAPEVTWEAMHAFRLETKRFRYTLEVFRDAYGPMMEKRIESLRKVQTFLGDINDCVVTSSMLANAQDGEKVREALRLKAESKTATLRKFWARTFDAPGESERWRTYLARYACRTRRRSSSPQPVASAKV